MTSRWRRTVLCLLTAAALATGACADPAATQSDPQPAGHLDGDFSGSGPGTLLSVTTMPMLDRRVLKVSSHAVRITYLSTSGIDGSEQVVSGSVYVPIGPPPPQGWPVVAFGHGSTGVQPECAPSLSTSLFGSVEAVATLVQAGYVVAMSDYQGLGVGEAASHPYLHATTQAYNLIDSVRAAARVDPGASNRWVAYGASQGGQASWAANELAGEYGAGLELVGSVSVSPAADVTGLADAAADGTLTIDQAAMLQWVLVAMADARPGVDLDLYRSGLIRDRWETFSSCDGQGGAERQRLAPMIGPDDLRPATPAATDELRAFLAESSLPRGPALAPLLVLFGGADQLVNPAWTEAAVAGACELGDSVEAYLVPDRGHDDISGTAALQWIEQRFAGVPPVSTCDLPDGPVATFAADAQSG